MTKKNICFIANYEKTLLFAKIADQLTDFNIYWITVNKTLYQNLVERYPKETIILIDKDAVLKKDKSEFNTDKYKLNELWLGDRVLKYECWGQKYLSNLSEIYFNFITTHTIDFVFGESTWAHELLAHRVCNLNNELGCRYLTPHTVRMPSGKFAFYSDEFQSEIAVYQPQDYDYPKVQKLEAKKPSYLALNDKILDQKTKLSFFIKKTKYFIGERINEAHDPTKPDSYFRAFKGFFSYYINKKKYQWFVKEAQFDEVKDRDFVLFTLHKQPEASIDNTGRYYEDQYEIIKNIWRILPEDTLLLVKEHSNAIGDRKLKYYKRIAQFKNVLFIHYKEDSYQIIKKAKAVFTISGTVAYESALMKTPAFTFIPIFFNKLSLCKHINFDDLRDPKTSLESLLKLVSYDEQTDQVYSNWINANSFEGIISDYNANPLCMEDENIDKLANALRIITSI